MSSDSHGRIVLSIYAAVEKPLSQSTLVPRELYAAWKPIN